MSQYTIHAKAVVEIDVYVEVEAKTKEDAIALVQETLDQIDLQLDCPSNVEEYIEPCPITWDIDQ